MVSNDKNFCNLVSLSKSTSKNPSQHRHFYTQEVSSMAQLAELMLHRVWSPIVWRDGLRLKDNFLEASYAALDFDDGRLTLKEALKLCEMQHLAFVLGTSKSHQLEKTTPKGKVLPPTDRFRLVFKMKSTTRDKNTFEHTMRALMDLYTCDPSCKDAGRFFFGCKEIIASSEGKELEWCEPSDEFFTKEKLARVQEEQRAYHLKRGLLPVWIQSALRRGRPEGQRHTTCYRLGATLIHYGFNETEIIELCEKSPLAEIGSHEIERAVLNGAERSRRESKSNNERKT